LDCAPKRDFRVLDWELLRDLFPKGARISPLAPSSEGAREVERGSQIMYWNNNGRAIYSVKRYPPLMMQYINLNIIIKKEINKKLNMGGTCHMI
jgi:hypothetical protein